MKASKNRNKVISWEQASAHFARLRRSGKKIVQCHGTFDMIHPGHIVHFEEAKALGDVLVVTVTSEKHVNKGPGRPYFNDQIRARWLAAIACVDFVVMVPYPAAVEAIECVRPHFYCKGREYENQKSDVTGNIKDDIATVTKLGAQIRYVGSIVFSSTRLLNKHFDPYPPEVKTFCQTVASECSPSQFRDIVDGFKKLKVLIIGDIIFDRYTTLEVQGLTSKNRIISGRFVSEEMQAGGSLAVLRHVREFTPHVKLFSIAGIEPWLEQTLSGFIRPEEDEITRAAEFTTVVKQRFVEPRSEGKELAKLFSVNYINRLPPPEAVQFTLLERLADQIEKFDLVIVMDFGHGLLEGILSTYVQQKARFLALNCQTNSNNQGFNIINRRYRRADSFSLDQTELTLAVGRRHVDFTNELAMIARDFGSSYAWLTRGSVESIGCYKGSEYCKCTPFERSVVDPLGAGDAFCSVASLAAVSGLSIELATFMGQLAGAQAVKIVGNSAPISKAQFLKSAMTMLSF